MRQTDILILLAELCDFLADQSDAEIIDGKAIANKAMKLMGECETAYTDIERSGVSNDR